MKKSTKTFTGSVAALASVASIIAPAATVLAAEKTAVEVAVDAVAYAEKTVNFFDWNLAFGKVVALGDKEPKYFELLARLSKIEATVKTDDVKAVLTAMDELAANKDLTNFYNIYELANKVGNEYNKGYLLNQLNDWGKKAVFTPEVVAATDALLKAWTDLTPASIAAAKEAAAKLTVAGNLNWVNAQIAEVEAKMALNVTSVSAVKANALKVVFNKAVDTTKATFEVKNGSFLVPVTVAWNDAKTEATLTKGFGKYIAGDYTVTVKGLDIKAGDDVAKTTIADEKIEAIEFTSASLVKTANVGEATVGYKVTNQYGEDITKTASLSGVSSFGTVSASAGVATVTKGSAWVTTDTTGSVTLYNGAKSVTTTVTLASAADVKTVTLGSMILPTDTERLIPSGTVTTAKISFSAVDQYGNAIKLPTGALVGITPVYGGGISNATVIADPNDSTKQLIQVDVPVVTAKTAATLTLIVNNNGAPSTTTFDMYPAAKVVDFTLTPDTKVIKAGASYKVWIDAVDTYGNAIKAADLAVDDSQFAITSLNTDIFTVAGDAIKLDATTKKAYVDVTAVQAGKTANLVVTVKANGKNATLPIAVNAASEIVGMKLSTNTLNYATNGSATLKATFIDQYNEEVKADANYSVVITSDDATVVAALGTKTVAQMVAGVTVAPVTGVTNDAAKLTVTLKQTTPAKDIDAQTVAINVVDSSKTTLTYSIDDVAKLNGLGSVDATSPYAAALKLTAKDASGNTIYVPNTVIKSVTSTNEALVKPVQDATTKAYTIVGLAAGIPSGSTEASATLTVIVENYDGTITTTTKSVTVSKAALAAASLKVYSAVDVELAGDVEGLVSGKIIDSAFAENATFFFEALDQYGVEMAIPNYVITNNTTGATVSVDPTTGVITVTGTPAAGTSFNITAITANGLLKTVKVVY